MSKRPLTPFQMSQEYRRRKVPSSQDSELIRLRAENAELREALEMIAGQRQCLDNLMSNADIARAVLAKHNQPKE